MFVRVGMRTLACMCMFAHQTVYVVHSVYVQYTITKGLCFRVYVFSLARQTEKDGDDFAKA